MPNFSKERSGYVFNDKGQLLMVTAPCLNLTYIIQRIQSFLDEMDIDSTQQGIRKSFYSDRHYKGKFYFSYKLIDNGISGTIRDRKRN